jgi:predicted amidophosphoribosyltransferase
VSAELPITPPASAPDEPTIPCPRCPSGYTGAWCPSCGHSPEPVPCEDGRDTHDRCVLCGRAICEPGAERPARCADHAAVPVISGWAQVYRAVDDIDAELIVQNLRAEGFDAQVFSQRDDIFPVDLGELNIVRVLVPVWEFEQALGVVLERMDSAGVVAFACPSCGEAYDPGDPVCASCGAALTAP